MGKQVEVGVEFMFESIKGTLIADGSEQVVVEASGSVRVSGYISLANMEEDDTVIIRQYMKLLNGEYERYASETYTGVQENPVIYITPKELASAIKVTLQQTGGTYKTFDYLFIKMPVSAPVYVNVPVNVTVNLPSAASFRLG
jgi:hypothetical protein